MYRSLKRVVIRKYTKLTKPVERKSGRIEDIKDSTFSKCIIKTGGVCKAWNELREVNIKWIRKVKSLSNIVTNKEYTIKTATQFDEG